MSFDLAFSENGDLIVAAHRDLAGTSGTALIEQRMKIRLRMQRGRWIYDFTQTLGSQLHTLSGLPSASATRYVDAYVREALRDMEEISVDEVQVIPTDHDLTVNVIYHQELTADDSAIPTDTDLQSLSFTIPVVAAFE
jgi:hypothetical protein